MDEVALKILWDRFVSVVNEQSKVLQRTAFSTLVREANDFACALMATNGETLAIADAALPSFATTQTITLRACLDRFPLDTWQEGDVLITNDAWIGTGQAMDFTLFKPVFHRGRLIAFTGSVAHSPDLGGVQRWNAATDIFEEALHVLPMFLYKAGKPNQTLFEIIEGNSRRPDQTIGDLHAQLSSNEVGERRLLEIVEEHNLETIDEVTEEIFTRSERAMRNAISQIPDGEYRFAMQADGVRGPLDRSESPAPSLDLVTRITVAGSTMEVDYSESSPQVAAAINSVYPFTFAYSAYTLRLLLVPHLPQNGGSIRPVKVIAKEGTVFNAAYPSASLNRSVIGHQVCDGIFGALSEQLPDRVWAMGGSTPTWLMILIGKDRLARPYQRIVPVNGGLGAHDGTDGEVCSFPANLSNTEVEILEAGTTVITEHKKLIEDSAGAGRYRGGLGVDLTVRATGETIYSLAFSRVKHPPRGILGGGDAKRGRVLHNGRELQPGAEGTLEPGDTLSIQTPGGGGFGAPSGRPRDLVIADVNEGRISAGVAVQLYGQHNL